MMAPCRYTHENYHVDKSCQTNGKGAQEQALVRVHDHDFPYLGIEGIAQTRDEEKSNE